MSTQAFCPFFKWIFFFFLSHLYVFFGKCLLSSLSLVGCFSDVEFYKLLILDVNPLSDIYFTNIFLPFYRLPFHVVDILFFLAVQNLQFDVILLLYFFFCYLCFWYHSQKKLPTPMSMDFLPLFSSRIFVSSGLTFKSLVHVDLALVSGVR